MDLDTLKLLYLALGPGIAIAIYIYYSDKWDPEPKGLVIRCFFLGGLGVFPSGYIENQAQVYVDIDMQAIEFGWTKVLYTFGVVALVEEMAKYLIFREFIYDDPHFNEPFDGVVYGGIIGAGFASVENLIYVTFYGTEVGVFRMLTTVPGHAFNGMILGYFMGTAKFSDKPQWEFFKGLTSVILLHGIYNSLALSRIVGSFYLFFTMTVLGIYFGLKAKRRLQHHSRNLEYSDNKYLLIKNGKKSGPFHLKEIRDRLGTGKISAEDILYDLASGKEASVKKTIHKEIGLERRVLARIPPMTRSLAEMVIFYFLTFGFFLFFWYYRTCRDIRSFRNLHLNPELRTVLFFIASTIPLFAFSRLQVWISRPDLPIGWEAGFALGTAAFETAFIVSLARLVEQTLHPRNHNSRFPYWVGAAFFIPGCLRKLIALGWFGDWILEVFLIVGQGVAMAGIQFTLNQFWTEKQAGLDGFRGKA